MAYIHDKGFCNRDFKLQNMLVEADYATIKIADFGFGAANQGINKSGFMSTILGTAGYIAPEMLETRPYQGRSVDMYALGVILFSMVTNKTPFS